MVWLSAIAHACMGPDDAAWLAEGAQRVYRGRIVELWDYQNAGTGGCGVGLEWLPPPTCEPLDRVERVGPDKVAVFEVLEVWKGPAERWAAVWFTGERNLWPGKTELVFQVDDHDTAACGWSGELGAPKARFEAEPTVEDLLWQAVAADDREAVRNALAAGPRLDRPHPGEVTEGCPPPAYDELVLAGARSVDALAGCGAERLRPMLWIVAPGDPGWQAVRYQAAPPLLEELEAAGVPLPLSPWILLSALDDPATLRWWLARGADPAALEAVRTPFPEEVYDVLAEAGVSFDCPW